LRPLPVIVAGDDGPSTFAHWVSAPDFGRSLGRFLRRDPVRGSHACAEIWSPEGKRLPHNAIRDAFSDDALLADLDALVESGLDLDAYPALIDCWDGASLNNSHFGDFARAHYVYYHDLAIEAARVYRATRQDTCELAAFTLEGWAQHYLTDSTAIGHAFNPAGNYEDATGTMRTTSLPSRLRVHNYLNDHTGRMAGALFDTIFLGDHSENHTADGRSLPEQESGIQWELTMRLARMGLGQVVAAAECGATPAAWEVLESLDAATDPRVVYTSNESMCAAMAGKEIPDWLPDLALTASLSDDALADVVLACKDGHGVLEGDAGDELAALYFRDIATISDDHVELLLGVDDGAKVELEDFGCDPGGDVVPLVDGAARARDACGQVLCDTPVQADGHCGAGMIATGGCCFARPAAEGGEGSGEIGVTPWKLVERQRVELRTRGAVPGESPEFLWLVREPSAPSLEDAGELAALERAGGEEPAALGGDGDAVDGCQTQGSFAVYAARVRIPAADAFATKVLALDVRAMDEGLKVQVDGRVVAYLTRRDGQDDPREVGGAFQSIHVELVSSAAPALADGTHLIELTHLNDCGDERPLAVSLSIDDKADAWGHGGGADTSGAGGCAVSAHAPIGTRTGLSVAGAIALIGTLLRRRGRRRVLR